MIARGRRPIAPPRREAALVLVVQLAAVVLVVGWLGTGHASAPDDGLLQLDVLSLHERVPGVTAQGGRPTMVVLTGACRAIPTSALPTRYGLVVHRPTDPGYAELARRLALPAAIHRCQPGYVLVDRTGLVRYRSYDPGWAAHTDEQTILLDAL